MISPQRQRFLRSVSAVALVAFAGQPLLAADVSIPPMQDAMAREAEPTRNFGEAGALAVAGPTAVNGANEPQGQYQSILQFDANIATSAFDTQFGPGNWQLTAASLSLYQVGAPINPIFNIGAGSVSFSWISDDNWLQGSGTPAPPPVDAGGNEISWNMLQSLVAGASTANLATAPVAVQTGTILIPLTLAPPFASDILAGGFVSIFAAAASSSVGFTFRAIEYFPDPSTGPRLVLTAQPLVDFDGDLNCDGVRNLSDLEPFVLALTDPDAYANQFPSCGVERADMDDDGFSDGRDIPGFVGVLLP